jgi:hypothetical protein
MARPCEQVARRPHKFMPLTLVLRALPHAELQMWGSRWFTTAKRMGLTSWCWEPEAWAASSGTLEAGNGPLRGLLGRLLSGPRHAPAMLKFSEPQRRLAGGASSRADERLRLAATLPSLRCLPPPLPFLQRNVELCGTGICERLRCQPRGGAGDCCQVKQRRRTCTA